MEAPYPSRQNISWLVSIRYNGIDFVPRPTMRAIGVGDEVLTISQENPACQHATLHEIVVCQVTPPRDPRNPLRTFE